MAANWRRVARRAALRHGINPHVFLRQINAESGFNPHAISPAGAVGIAQIMPATAAGWGVNPRNPRASLNAAAGVMASYLRSYRGDWRMALAAYNAGPGAVAKYHGVPPYSETQAYVQRILAGMPRFNHPSHFALGQGPQRPHPQNLGALVSLLAQQGGIGQQPIKPQQLHAQLLSQPGATTAPGLGGLTPNPTTATGVPTNELYSQIQQLRRRLLGA